MRRECLDRLLIFGRRQLQYVLRVYLRHFNQQRPHRALNHELPIAAAEPILRPQRPFIHCRSGGATSSAVCSTNTKPLHEDRVCAPHAADGSASGEAQIENRSSGFLGHAEIDCLNVLGNVAVMSGVYTFASNPDLVGSDVLFAVRDNGEGPSAPTRSRSPSRASGSRARTSPTPLSWHCSSHPSRVDRSKSGPEQASAR